MADSPRAVERELVRRDLPLRRRWLLPEGASAPAGAEAVIAGTEEARAALEAADFIVSNTYLLQQFQKAPGAVYLQTWHGTPLKKIGHNINVPRQVLEYEVTSREDARRWDFMVAPNEFTVPILEEEFAGTPLLKTGYPRNDILLSAEADRVRRDTRDALGLEDSQTAVLYAPTWRDDDLSVRFGLEPAGLETILGAEFVILARSHVLTPSAESPSDFPGWRDVTSWPDIADLYLAADVLITDYSSAMFDFAVTGKPQLFYTYDLEHYRDRLRGFYFDFEAEAPGPLPRTPDEIATALTRLDEIRERYAEKYAAFQQRFCHWDDGRASARVVDAMLKRRT